MEYPDNQILLSSIHEDYYNLSIFKTMRNFRGKNVCYVTLNKPASSLQSAFKVRRFTDVFYVDAVSGKDANNVMKVSSPASLSELKTVLDEVVNSKVFDVIIFDSVSTLNKFPVEWRRYVSDMIAHIRESPTKAVFFSVEDEESEKQVRSYVDEVVSFDDYYNKLRRNKLIGTYAFVLMIALGFAVFGSKEIAISGMFVSELNSPVGWVVYGIIVFLAAFLVFKGASISPIAEKKLLALEPVSRDLVDVAKEVQDKIKNWHGK